MVFCMELLESTQEKLILEQLKSYYYTSQL